MVDNQVFRVNEIIHIEAALSPRGDVSRITFKNGTVVEANGSVEKLFGVFFEEDELEGEQDEPE